MLERIRGRTLNRRSDTLHYLDSVTKEEFGRHEIDWMLAHGLVTKTINMQRFIFEFRVNPYYN